jgi:hypothetical protein
MRVLGICVLLLSMVVVLVSLYECLIDWLLPSDAEQERLNYHASLVESGVIKREL